MATSQTSSPKRLARGKPRLYSACVLYDTEASKEKLRGLSLAACNPAIEKEEVGTELPPEQPRSVEGNADSPAVPERLELTVSDKMSCNYCSIQFTSRHEQKSHYRSDWHRYNLKQRIRGRNSVTEEQFEIISGAISSLSGSDSDSDISDSETDTTSQQDLKAQRKPKGIPTRLRGSGNSSTDSESETGMIQTDLKARRLPKVYFRNESGELISLYRCVICHKKNQPKQSSELVALAADIPNHMTWAVFMSGGGHFAGAVFDKKNILAHKTFHRYIVRAKRGTAQGSRDSQGNAPKSAGASVRRYNEAALTQEIQELINSWSEYIEKCDIIFLRAPSFNKMIFFSGKNPPFKKDDERIRMIPFQTKRPTHNEIRRVHETLATIEIYGEEAHMQDFIPVSPAKSFDAESGRLNVLDDQQLSPRHRKYRNKKLGASPLTSDVQSDPDIGKGMLSKEGEAEKPEETSTDVSKSVGLALPDHIKQERSIPSSSGTSTGSESELVETMETINLLELKEFAYTKKPKRKKKQHRKRRPSLKHQPDPDSNVCEEEKYHLKNALYTACKIGDIETLKNLLAIFPSQAACRAWQATQHQSDITADTNTAGTETSSSQSRGHMDNSSQSNACEENMDQSDAHDSPVQPENPTDDVMSSFSPELSIRIDSENVKQDKYENLVDISNSVEVQSNDFDRNISETGYSCSTNTETEHTSAGTEALCNNDVTVVHGTNHLREHLKVSENDGDKNKEKGTETSTIELSSGEREECILVGMSVSNSQTENSKTSATVSESTVIDTYIGDNESSCDKLTRTSMGSDKIPNCLPLNSQKQEVYPVAKVMYGGVTMAIDMSPVVTADILNETFGDNKTTLLHVAAKESKKDVVKSLLEAGADPAVRDKAGQTPYTTASDKGTRNEFRRFMAQYPDMFDYTKAQIPGPLTTEMEEERKQKDAEKKRAQRKAKAERQKGKKAEEAVKKAEEEEKNRYLALSDREKRALAAEKRLLAQADRSGMSKPVLSRCWQCGEDMTGKVPFEYSDFKFCTTKCLQAHRKQHQQTKAR